MLTGTSGQAAAAALVALQHDVLGSVLYTLAVNHKLMCVYYAPAFFGHLLGRCLQRPTLVQQVRSPLRLPASSTITNDLPRHHRMFVVMMICRRTRSRSWASLSSAHACCAGYHTSAP